MSISKILSTWMLYTNFQRRYEMKRLLIPVLVLLLVGYLTFAEGAPKSGDFGIQGGVVFTNLGNIGVSPNGTLGVKYFVNENVALRAGFGIVSVASGGASTTGYAFGAGFEYHFGLKGGVSPYAGAAISYSSESLSGGAPAASDLGIKAVLGAEYFFSNNFSWAGELGLGYDSFYNPGPPAATTSSIGTIGFGSFLTYYLN
jgi:Outer membrane protein beta-barrel domain